MEYSVVIPVFNEEENVAKLHADILEVMNSLGKPFEMIFIDDGSSDNTVAELHKLTPITIVELRRNFGQTAAMDAGIKTATGEIIITLDGDGQNPPSEIPKLLNHMAETGVDIVSGWRKNRKDTAMKHFVSRGAYMLRRFLVKDDIHDSGCSLKAYRRECFNEVDLHGEMHRFIPAVLSWSGYTVGEVVVSHKPREFGSSKYNWRRIIKGFIDMISVLFWRKYANRPLHLFGALGLILAMLGSALLAYLGIQKIFFQAQLTNSSLPLLSALFLILGVNFFISGILADIAIKSYYKNTTYYSVKKTTNK